jgi:hypothetical protein
MVQLYLVIHVHDVHLLKDEFWTALVLLRHLANGHVRDVDGSDAPGKILTVPMSIK